MTDRVIRPSSLTTAADCTRRWAAHNLAEMVLSAGYTLQPARMTHVGAAVGSGIHAAALYTLGEKKDHGTLGNASEAEDRAVAEFDARAEYGLDWDETTAGLSVAKQQIARMTGSFRRHLGPVLEPMVVEVRFDADLGGGGRLSGQPDVMTGDPGTTIRDLKTGVRRRMNAMQYGAYAMLIEAHGHDVVAITEDYIPRVKVKAEQPPPLSVVIPVKDAALEAIEAIDDIRRSTDEFERRTKDPQGRPPHTAYRANPASALCSARWCRAWGTSFCTAHKSEEPR